MIATMAAYVTAHKAPAPSSMQSAAHSLNSSIVSCDEYVTHEQLLAVLKQNRHQPKPHAGDCSLLATDAEGS